MINKIFLFLILFSGLLFSQSITFDEFQNHYKKLLNVKALQAIQDYFPENFVITAVDLGDFSGDNKTDFAIAVKPARAKNRNIFVFMFCDSVNQYIPVFTDTLAYVELPVEIGFNISEEVCYVTHKLKEASWTITGYSFLNNEFSIVDYYTTDVNPLGKKNTIGVEKYENYRKLNSFISFYNANTLKEYKKNKFLVHPVYDKKRNIYKGFHEKQPINDLWLWSDTAQFSTNENSYIRFTSDSSNLPADVVLSNEFLEKFDPHGNNSLKFYFNISDVYVTEDKAKKEPSFKKGFDNNIGWIEINFNLQDTVKPQVNIFFGSNYNDIPKDKIKLISFRDSNLHFTLEIPLIVFNFPENNNKTGVFISLLLNSKDGKLLTYSNSSGNENDPSSYGHLIFIGNDEYYGLIKNYRFKKLVEKLFLNGLISKKNE